MSQIDKTKEVERLLKENEELKNTIKTLIDISDNEFDMLRDGIEEALKLLYIDPILRIRQGIDKQKIIDTVKNNIKPLETQASTDSCDVGTNEDMGETDSLDYTQVSFDDIQIDSSKNNSNCNESNYEESKTNEKPKQLTDIEPEALDKQFNADELELETFSILDENLQISDDAVAGGGKKPLKPVILQEPKFITDKKKTLTLEQVFKTVHSARNVKNIKKFLSQVSYSELFTSPDLEQKAQRYRYFIIYTIQYEHKVQNESHVLATNLAYNCMDRLAFHLNHSKLEAILKEKFKNNKNCKNKLVRESIEFLLNNSEEIRENFLNYSKYIDNMQITKDWANKLFESMLPNIEAYRDMKKVKGLIK